MKEIAGIDGAVRASGGRAARCFAREPSATGQNRLMPTEVMDDLRN